MYEKPIISPISSNEGTTERGMCHSNWCTNYNYVWQGNAVAYHDWIVATEVAGAAAGAALWAVIKIKVAVATRKGRVKLYLV